MNITNLEVELRKIQALVTRWSEQGYVPQIEKNIALQRVQKFYELFLELDTQPQIEYRSEPIVTPPPVVEEADHSADRAEIDSAKTDDRDVVEYVEVESKKRETTENAEEKLFSIFGVEISNEQKKRFTHNLFCNDPLVFHNEITKLERLASLDDVLIYIGERYAWAPDNASADEFIEIIARHYK
ncbi:MAG: hypothetical protein RR980_02685 [Mucinivorans sp.]